jgi:UDP-N-acetylglucosamine 2-epimerase (non-hydrolysing)
MVQGDTASAFACALAAFNKELGVIHLEAGLRTHNRKHPYPEEAYRQSISRLTDIHLCATEANKKNLEEENVKGEIHVVGNTVLDTLIETRTSYNNDILITLHRRENHKSMPFWYKQIEDVASVNPDLNFIFVSHPNPDSRCTLKKQLSNVSIIPPVAHKEFVKRIGSCRFLITDSGGLQEEASFLKKKVIVCRETTERPEALGTFTYLCKSVGELPELFNKVKEDFTPEGDCPFGDGKAAEKILQLL